MDIAAIASVLILDDERIIQRQLADALVRQGFSVTVECEGPWALQTFESIGFDAILLDLALPSLDGRELIRQIRKSPSGATIPILVMSAEPLDEQEQQWLFDELGVTSIFGRPPRTPALLKALQTALGERYPTPPLPEAPAAPEPPPPQQLVDRAAHEEASQVESQSSSPAAAAPSLRGTFREAHFPEILAEIHRWRGTGALLLRRDKVKKIVFFREGIPQFVKSNLLSECLGRIMVKERIISEAVCEESLRRMKASGRQQGTLLIEMGCISPHNLAYVLNLQLRIKLFDIFSWRAGDYRFDPSVALPAEVVNLEMSTAAVIYEGIRRAYDQERLHRVLGPQVDPLFVHPASDPLYALQDMGLEEEEHLLLEAADGYKTVATLRALNLLPPLETDRLLYALCCARMVELKGEPAEGKPAMMFQGMLPPPLPRSTPPPAAEDSLPDLDISVDESSPSPARPKHAPLLPDLAEPTTAKDESLVRERLAARVAAMRKMNLFEILGIPRNAGDNEVAQAYVALVRENHPDRMYAYASAEIRQLAGQIYELISCAHTTLRDPEEKARYLRELEQGIQREVGQDVGKILTAEGKFQRGEHLLSHGKYSEAYPLFQEAVNLYGEEGEFHAYLGFCRYLLDPHNPEVAEQALRSLEHALHLNPRSDKTYLFTGHVYRALGRAELAERQFEKAIQANPGCVEALRELSLVNWAKPGERR